MEHDYIGLDNLFAIPWGDKWYREYGLKVNIHIKEFVSEDSNTTRVAQLI